MAGELSQEIQFRINQYGAENVLKALDQLDAKVNQHSKTTSGLTKFIREQRQENRMQNFLFREGKDAIGSVTFAMLALTNATGNHSKTTQQLNKTLVASFSAFQAADFAMVGLGIASGGTALAIAGVAGAGVGLLSFLDDSEEKTKKSEKALKDYNEQLEKSVEGLSPQRTKYELDLAKAMLASGKAALEKAKSDRSWTKVNEENLKGLDRAIVQEQAFVDTYEARVRILERMMGAQEQANIVEARGAEGLISQQELKLKNLKEELNTLSDIFEIRAKNIEIERAELELNLIKQGQTLEGKSAEFIGRAAGLKMKTAQDIADKVGGKMAKRFGLPTVELIDINKLTLAQKLILETISAEREMQEQFLNDLSYGFSALGSGLASLGVSSESLLNKLITSVQYAIKIADLISKISKGSVSGFTGGLGIFGSALGIIGTLFGSKQSIPSPIATPGGITSSMRGQTNIIINAVDAGSIKKMLSNPENTSAFTQAIFGRLEKGKF